MLARISELARAHRVTFTLKAFRELAALQLGMDVEDACDVLVHLTATDSAGRLASAVTGEWLYVFKPRVEKTVIYVKVIIRNDCVVVSFHADEGAGHDEGA
ncbi:MAG TPA: type II toxin-antitoxin system MqsR family toxin [Kofleriaceae bacterium]|nr:type II toxin-antitoxin system MqsR family toxin [Kofleriaceae bacterium]